MTSQQQPVITKCPPGYAWGYNSSHISFFTDTIRSISVKSNCNPYGETTVKKQKLNSNDTRT